MSTDPHYQRRRHDRDLARLRGNYLRALDALGEAMSRARAVVLDPDSEPWTRAQRDAVAATGKAWWELGTRARYDDARRQPDQK